MKPFAWFKPEQHDYSPLPDDTEGKQEPVRAPSTGSRRFWWLKAGLVCLFVLCSFFAGRFSMSVPRAGGNTAIEFETSSRLFQYNSTFGEAPSDGTNAAWDSLFPRHGGFFVHPTLAPKRAAFSVFHQMHCLDELRHAFYYLHYQMYPDPEVIDGDGTLHMRSSHSAKRPERPKRALQEHSLGHIRHCIDLLRQSLMCNADLTVEVKDEELAGVRGFGTVHQCIDWSSLMEWIRPYEETDAPPVMDIHEQEHGHEHGHDENGQTG